MACLPEYQLMALQHMAVVSTHLYISIDATKNMFQRERERNKKNKKKGSTSQLSFNGSPIIPYHLSPRHLGPPNIPSLFFFFFYSSVSIKINKNTGLSFSSTGPYSLYWAPVSNLYWAMELEAQQWPFLPRIGLLFGFLFLGCKVRRPSSGLSFLVQDCFGPLVLLLGYRMPTILGVEKVGSMPCIWAFLFTQYMICKESFCSYRPIKYWAFQCLNT